MTPWLLAAAAEPTPANRFALPESIREISLSRPNQADEPVRLAVPLDAQENAATTEVEVSLRLRNFVELQARIARGDILTLDELEQRYYPARTDYNAVADWLTGEHLTVTGGSSTRLAVFARGAVQDVARTFATDFDHVAAGDSVVVAAVTIPSVPRDLAAPVLGINGLQSFAPARPQSAGPGTPGTPLRPRSGTPLKPAQIAKNYQADHLAVTGSGQKIAIVVDGFPALSDLTAFWTAGNISQSVNNIELVQAVSGTAPTASGEETLDVSWASAMAPGAKVRVYGTSDLATIHLNQAYEQVIGDLATQPTLHQLSLSFGLGETYRSVSSIQSETQYMAILAAAGVSVFASAGDGGSNPGTGRNSQSNGSGPLQAADPASNPFITAVGGTSVTLDGSGNIAGESAWANGGGGLSVVYSRPSWQVGTGVPAGTMRAVPDVSAIADSDAGALLVFKGQQTSTGGTSLSAPIWAGFCALLNQARANAGQRPLGLLNPKLYRLIGTSSFRDITTGNNGGYNAGPGFDLCTGVGVPNMAALVQALSGAPTVTLQPTPQSVGSGQNAVFTVAASGSPAPTYQWQRLPAGAATWTNVTDGGAFSGTSTATLTITGVTSAMGGDQYQCIVTNPLDVDVSSPAALNVEVPFSVTTFAGFAAASGQTNATGTNARFGGPYGVATDAAGNVYVADYSNHAIRKITPQAVVTTYAGRPGISGAADGAAAQATFNLPAGLATDPTGNLYVADSGNHTIRKIAPDGTVSTLAGTVGSSGSSDGTGSGAKFSGPRGVAVDASGNVFVADYGNYTIRRVTPAGVVTTVVGQAGVSGPDDGFGTSARLFFPRGVAFDSLGNLYISDWGNSAVRKMTPSGLVTTLAGLPQSEGSADGVGTQARFLAPVGITVDRQGNVFVADSANSAVRRITPGGVVTTPIGVALSVGSGDGYDTAARLNGPFGLAFDPAGNLFIADLISLTVRKATPDAATPLAPIIIAGPPEIVSVNGGDAATFSVTAHANPGATYQWQRRPKGASNWATLTDGGAYRGASSSTLAVAATTFGMDGDQFQCVVSNASGTVTTAPVTNLSVNLPYAVATLAGRTPGRADGTGSDAQFGDPRGIAEDASGNLYVADGSNNTIRKITPAGVVTTVAGSPGGSGSLDGNGPNARFRDPLGVAVDSAGNLYVADSLNFTIRKITPGGVVSTLAGSAGISGFADGQGSLARFGEPFGVAVDSAGNVFVADYGNDTIRKITPAGLVSTLAGSATAPSGSVDGLGASARFNSPEGVAVDAGGNIYVADTFNFTIRKVTPSGAVSTIAGLAANSGVADGAGANARFTRPRGITLDAAGNLYVADSYNDTIRKITPAGLVTTLAGSPGLIGSADGIGSHAHFYTPSAVVVDPNGTLFVADSSGTTIRSIAVPLPVAAPVVKTAPADQTAPPGGTVTFSVAVTGYPGPSYQWTHNNAPILGAVGPTLVLNNLTAADAGAYAVTISNPVSSITSPVANLSISISRLVNLSVRSNAGTGDQTLIVGLSVSNAGPNATKSVLVRAIGPSLGAFGIAGFLADPAITLQGSAGVSLTNDNWGGNAQVAAVSSQVGAFPLASADSKDAALVTALPSGSFTVQIGSVDGTQGNALFEVYDAVSDANFTSTSPRLINASTRTTVGTGDGILIAGFVVGGNAKKTVLVRAVGPTLGKFGVGGVLADPQLTLYKSGSSTPIATNDNWGGTPSLAASFTQVGAFALDADSKDAVLLVTLDPGAYTAQVSGVNGTTGVALLELYEMP